MTTNDQLAEMIRGIDLRLIRLDVYVKGIAVKLLAPAEINQLENIAAQAERLNQPSTAGT